MRRFVTSFIVAATGPLWWAAPIRVPASDVPSDPCTVLTRPQVERLLLGKRVVRVRRRHNSRNGAVECTWITGFFQTKSLQRAHDPLSLRLTVQPTATASAALDELRARTRNPTNEITTTVPTLGDEAYLHLGEVIAVSGDVVVEAGLSNYDTSIAPYPAVDRLAAEAAAVALHALHQGASTPATPPRWAPTTGSRPAFRSEVQPPADCRPVVSAAGADEPRTTPVGRISTTLRAPSRPRLLGAPSRRSSTVSAC
ncbi:MAG TPA: hypothetical protein VLV81_05290 [Acidimicrobiia bacterium]|nr:hypothetical protein [Acidimicrobiia bacterium]